MVVVVSDENLDYCQTFLELRFMSESVCVLNHSINVKMLYHFPNIKRTHRRLVNWP